MHDSPSFRNDDASNGGIIFAVLNFRCLPHEMEILTELRSEFMFIFTRLRPFQNLSYNILNHNFISLLLQI